MEKNLKSLLDQIDYLDYKGKKDLNVTGISHDSRSVEPGDAFVAISGLHSDGHDYIENAVRNGAVTVFGEKKPADLSFKPESYIRIRDSRKLLARISHLFYDRPTKNLYSVGITGTNGKTTTAHFAGLVLGEDRTETISTITNTDETQVEGPVTTPEAPSIQQRAFRAFREGKKNLVLEVSSHSLSLDRVRSVDFDCAVFTNLTRDHLDYHDSMAAYGKEKLKLFQSLSGEDTAIVNSDDDFSEKIVRETQAEVLGYGLGKQADVIAREVEQLRQGISFNINSPWGRASVRLGFLGRYNVYNALAAATIGLVKGREIKDIVADLERAETLAGRMERIKLNNGSHIYVDFAHNPGALKRALSELKDIYDSVLVVFGCGGESDRGKRPKMGKIATELADMAYITDDNPKKEDRTKILREIEHGIEKEEKYEIIPERKEAIEAAIEDLRSGGCLLVAGKGHERHQIVSDNWLDYNDAEYIKELAKEKSLLSQS